MSSTSFKLLINHLPETWVNSSRFGLCFVLFLQVFCSLSILVKLHNRENRKLTICSTAFRPWIPDVLISFPFIFLINLIFCRTSSHSVCLTRLDRCDALCRLQHPNVLHLPYNDLLNKQAMKMQSNFPIMHIHCLDKTPQVLLVVADHLQFSFIFFFSGHLIKIFLTFLAPVHLTSR